MRKALIHVKRSMKFIILAFIAAALGIAAVGLFYKPIYSVTINGEAVGYSGNKTELQAKINKYMESGEEGSENIAFVQIDDMPQYRLCLLKKDIVTNDDEIFDMVKASGTVYYRYFSVLESGEEKKYTANFETAESAVNQLKEKESTNIDNISIIEKYEKELQEFSSEETIVSDMYQEPEPEPEPQVTVAATKKTKSSGNFTTSSDTSGGTASLGINLINPVSGTITSRFGAKSSLRKSVHTGLDIAVSSGTTFTAAASGTVIFAGYKGSYGNMIVIDHGNGVQTYYGHASKLYVTAGESVAQGEAIGAVGSTGNSTGPHLHLEVRVNGVAYNPQNYVY